MNKLFAKLSAMLTVAFAFVFSALAEGEGGASIDVSAATTAISNMKDAADTWWDAAQPVFLAVVGVALVATLIWCGYKLIRKAVGKIG